MGTKSMPSSGYISNALRGDQGPSEDIQHTKVGRPDQKICTAHAMDNVDLAMDITSSLKETGGFAGGVNNLEHSLKGASAMQDVGAAGKTKSSIIPNH